jgi:two-component system, NarL family, sensor histidine kinase DegS
MSVMNIWSKPWLTQSRKSLHTLHFWLIALLMVLITVLYYQTTFFGSRVFPFAWNLELFEFNYNFIGSLYCLPLVYAALVFWWRGILITWLLSMFLILPKILTFRPDPVSHLTNVFYLLIPLLVVIYVSLELNWRNKEKKAMAEREVERQNYISEVFKAQEDERKRISLEIHDDSIQRLAVAASATQLLIANPPVQDSPELEKKIEGIRDMIISISVDLRRLSIDLRPTVLDDLGLVPALRWLVDSFQQETGIRAQIEITGKPGELSKKTTVLVFRIVQEALSNIRKHSQASQVAVALQFADQRIRVTIQDNGKGFNVPEHFNALMYQGKLGLIGMQQRTQVMGGVFNIHSELGKGTRISVEVGA